MKHLFAGPGEQFAFLLCRWWPSTNGPLLVAVDTFLVNPEDVAADDDGWTLSDHALDRVMNKAACTGFVLVEAHNHGLGPPRFSAIDRAGLEPFANYVLQSFPDRPYGATVWADDAAYGEWFARGDNDDLDSGIIDRITVTGRAVRTLIAAKPKSVEMITLNRQLGVFGISGQQTLAQLRVAIVGIGGTGSHMAQGLAYLGVRDFVLVDEDRVEVTNLNRLVMATPADIDIPKVVTAKRAIRTIAPNAVVRTVKASIEAEDDHVAKSLADADLIIGCVDDDGPRLLLNRIAITHQIPYVDVATGITVDGGHTVEAGGRIAFTLPGGLCLLCTDELDIDEVRAYFLTDTERHLGRQHGYITGTGAPAPSVVSLNGLAVNVAINELTLWIAGIRPPAPRIDIDLLGCSSPVGPRVTPRRAVDRRDDCVECGTLTLANS